MTQELVIIGAGGHARELADVVDACIQSGQDLKLLGFLDDDSSTHGNELCGHRVLGPAAWIRSNSNVRVILGIGSPQSKRAVVEQLADHPIRYQTLIHPRAEVTRWVKFGEGVVITAGCVVTNEIELGDHVHLNRLSTVGHDCVVERYAHIAPGAVVSGNVQVGVGCDVGSKACIIQNIRVGSWSVIGAGAVVISDVPANVTAVGVPARVVSS